MVEAVKGSQLLDIVFKSRVNIGPHDKSDTGVEKRDKESFKDSVKVFARAVGMMEIPYTGMRKAVLKASLGEEIRSSVLDRLNLRGPLDIPYDDIH